MRVLWIKSDFPLPADTGGKIRTLHLMTGLAQKTELTLLCYAAPDHPRKYFSELRQLGIKLEVIIRAEEIKRGLQFELRVFWRLFSNKPYIVNKYISDEMAGFLRDHANSSDYDVVLCDFLEMAWCCEFVSDIPCVLFEHNVETTIWRRYFKVESNPLRKLYFWREKGRIARYESSACSRFDHVFTVSRNDGKTLHDEFGLSSYTELPTGVDTNYFQPREGGISGRLVFCGSMDWMPNIDGFWWFYKSIFPLVKSEIPGVSLAVVGRRPNDEIKATQASDPSVTVTGTVDDVRPHVAAGEIYIVPLRIGGGTRIKIYEAMAMKKCVVSTTVGAEGLPLTHGRDIVIADTEREFANCIKELLRNRQERNNIAEAGFRLVTENYCWAKATEVLHAKLQQVLNKREPAKAD